MRAKLREEEAQKRAQEEAAAARKRLEDELAERARLAEWEAMQACGAFGWSSGAARSVERICASVTVIIALIV